MTAEIAVLNKSAVALAADSAVTIGRGSSAKIFNTVNKIFELSAHQPIGIMIYGRLDFMGYPIETLVKQYRKRLGRTSYPTLEHYSQDFFEWLQHSLPISDEDKRHNTIIVLADLIQKINHKIDDKILAGIKKRSRYLVSKDNGIAQSVVNAEIKELQAHDILPEYRTSRNHILDDIDQEVGIVIGYFIDRFQPTDTTKARLKRYLAEGLCRATLSDARMGIVFAGFGEDEMLPSLIAYETDGILLGRLKYIETKKVVIQSHGDVQADAIGFAQDDMIKRFLHGVDPDFDVYIDELMRQFKDSIVERVVGSFSPNKTIEFEATQRLAEVFDDIHNEHLDKIKAYKKTSFTDPIVNIIRHMPKQEIANLAQSLIDITSLKRKVSREQETVGGDVDVAVISKTEGFVWIKRKHYFAAEINPRFFSRQYGERERLDDTKAGESGNVSQPPDPGLDGGSANGILAE